MRARTAGFGAFLRENRLKEGFGLREFCRLHGYNAGNMSRCERGLTRPPHRQRALEKLASRLGLKKGSGDWTTFMELAAISAGRIPDRIMEDTALASKLPLIFSTVTGDRLSEEKLRRLAELIRRT